MGREWVKLWTKTIKSMKQVREMLCCISGYSHFICWHLFSTWHDSLTPERNFGSVTLLKDRQLLVLIVKISWAYRIQQGNVRTLFFTLFPVYQEGCGWQQ